MPPPPRPLRKCCRSAVCADNHVCGVLRTKARASLATFRHSHVQDRHSRGWQTRTHDCETKITKKVHGSIAAIPHARTASFCSVVKRRRRATPVMTSTRENVSDIGIAPGLSPGPAVRAGVRSTEVQFSHGSSELRQTRVGRSIPVSGIGPIRRDRAGAPRRPAPIRWTRV
jgi:hypothetical protein